MSVVDAHKTGNNHFMPVFYLIHAETHNYAG